MGAVQKISLGLLALAPLSWLAVGLDWGDAAVCLTAVGSIMGLAIWMSQATEELGVALGPSIGSLLNAVFGNATELILALAALRAGLVTIVKASITGSLIGNLLLTLGLAMLAGGIGRREQRFRPVVARVSGTAMSLAVLAMLIPSLASLGVHPSDSLEAARSTASFSRFVAWLLLLVYGLTLLFSLRTHRNLYQLLEEEPEASPDRDQADAAAHDTAPSAHASGARPSLRLWLTVLLGAAALLAVESELFMGVIEPVSERLHLPASFTGIVLLPLLGGLPEYVTAVGLARRNKMHLSVSVAFGCTLLVALLMVPVLVLCGPLLGHPFDLSFDVYEVVAVISAVVISNLVSLDGRSDWLEGVLLLGAYGILAAGFWYQATPALPI
ncbi:MAG: calcium/proton exchanger [Synechococcaceae cyanobacterium]|nr:calcium/proton exchanger [Synechococcaceae cyanobacterium]